MITQGIYGIISDMNFKKERAFLWQRARIRGLKKYLTLDDTYISCVFGEEKGGKVVTKGTYAKMARGEMVRYMAENQIENIEAIKEFDRLHFSYIDDLSSETEYVFLRET